MTARRHHYVSQCYLRGFGQIPEGGKVHQVFVSDRSGNSFTSSIANVAAERDFNLINVNGQAPDALEKLFANFESDLPNAIADVTENGHFRNLESKSLLLNFIALIGLRNPRQRKMRSGDCTGELSTETHIRSEMSTFSTVLPSLFERGWLALHASENSSGFVTSDFPVRISFEDPNRSSVSYEDAKSLEGANVLFPLTRRIALIGSYSFCQDDRDNLDEKGVSAINGAIAEAATQQVYSWSSTALYSWDGGIPTSVMELSRDPVFHHPSGY